MITYPTSSNFSKKIFLALFSPLQYSFLHYVTHKISCLLLLMISYLLHFNRKMKLKKGNTQMKFKHLLFLREHDQNMFKANLMLQFYG